MGTLVSGSEPHPTNDLRTHRGYMSRLTGWLYSLRAFVRRNDADRDMAEEIAFHVDRQNAKARVARIVE